MGIELTWDNAEQTVMRCEFGRAWTWEELDAVLAQIKQITDSAGREIAAIIDLSAGVTLPGGTIFSPAALNQARKILRMGEGGSGPVIVVGASPTIKSIYGAFRGFDPNSVQKVTLVNTLEEARALLADGNGAAPT